MGVGLDPRAGEDGQGVAQGDQYGRHASESHADADRSDQAQRAYGRRWDGGRSLLVGGAPEGDAAGAGRNPGDEDGTATNQFADVGRCFHGNLLRGDEASPQI